MGAKYDDTITEREKMISQQLMDIQLALDRIIRILYEMNEKLGKLS